jgi:ABC-2 type transport system permease protein
MTSRLTYWRQVTAVARWEFLRFVKLKQQVYSFLIMSGLGLGFGALGYFVAKSRAKPVTVALLSAERFGSALPPVDGVSWRRETDEAAASRALAAKTLDGYVVVVSPDSARIVLRDKAKWPSRVQAKFIEARRAHAMQQSGITPEQLAAIGARMQFATVFTKRKSDSSAADVAVALAILFLAFTGIMTGAQYLFTGITGEKQLRVTDAILSAIAPGAWLDGKILGQLGVAMVGIANTIGSLTVLGGGVLLVFGDKLPDFDIPWPGIGVLLQVIVLVLLGLVLWYALLGAFTSTIDDPNSSMRSSIMILPMLPMYVAWMLVDKADTPLAAGLSIFPFTSYAALPVRLATTSPALWEFPVAVVLLVAAIWGTRLVGSRLFAAGVQTYGKEPGIREMWAAMRNA